MSGLQRRARMGRMRRITASAAVVAVIAVSGVVPLAAAAATVEAEVGAEPPAVDIPLFGPTTPKAKTPKASKPKARADKPEATEPGQADGAGAEAKEPNAAEGRADPEAKPSAEAPTPGDPGEAGPGAPDEPAPAEGESAADLDLDLDLDLAPASEPASASAGSPEAEVPAEGAAGEAVAVTAAADEAAAGEAAGGEAAGDEPAADGGAPDRTAPDEGPPVNDGPVTVTTKIGPDPSFVGDLLTLEIIAAYPKGYRVNLPTGVDFSPLHLVSIEEGEPEPSAEGYFRKVFTVTLQHFDTGESRVPGFPLTYVGASGEVETVRVAPRSFMVDSLLANEAEPERKLEDPPISLEYPNTTAELVIYSAAVAMLAGFFLALFWRRFASRRQVVVGPPPVPAHELALSALDELERSEFLETGLVQDYYLELTEIAKGYLEGRFGVDALDRTTDEIRRDLIRHRDRIRPLEPDDVLRFLEGCDLVKFARFDPELDEARSALQEVRTMVQETVPTVGPTMTSIGATGDGAGAGEGVDAPSSASKAAGAGGTEDAESASGAGGDELKVTGTGDPQVHGGADDAASVGAGSDDVQVAGGADDAEVADQTDDGRAATATPAAATTTAEGEERA